MNRCAFLLLCLYLLAQACTPKSSGDPTSGLVYDLTERSGSDQSHLQVKQGSCTADSQGKISIQLDLMNATGEIITLALQDFELETESGLRSAPVSPVSSVISIPTQAVKTITLVFEPVNSLRLLHLTGLRGDLGRWYRLTLPGDEGGIKFQLSEADYASYKSSRKEVRVFALTYPGEFEKNQLNYLRDSLGFPENGVALHEEEVLVNGLNSALAAYTYNDTLIVKARLVNHSLLPVRVKLSEFSVGQMEEMKSPLPVNPDSFVIPRSQRAQVELRYPLSGKTFNQFSLSVKTMSFLTPDPVPVFYTDMLEMKHVVLSDK